MLGLELYCHFCQELKLGLGLELRIRVRIRVRVRVFVYVINIMFWLPNTELCIGADSDTKQKQ